VGLIYLRARYYDPATGRFLSKDPAGGKLSSPVTQNKYVYAGNNPVNGGDPTGLSTVTNAMMDSWMANVPVTYWTPSGGYTSSFSAYSGAFQASRSAPTPVSGGGGRASVSSAAAPSIVPDRTLIFCEGRREWTVNADDSPNTGYRSFTAKVRAYARAVWEAGSLSVFASALYDNDLFGFQAFYDTAMFDLSPLGSDSIRPSNGYGAGGGVTYARGPDSLPREIDILTRVNSKSIKIHGQNPFSIGLHCR